MGSVEYDEATVERLVADRERQGLPRQCTDPVILAEVAAALLEESEE